MEQLKARDFGKAIKEVLPLFLVSRALFFSILFLSASARLELLDSREGGLFHVYFHREFIVENLIKTLLSADASWYMEIAKYGYPPLTAMGGPKHWVFFPAFPLVVAFFSKITISYLAAAIILNAGFFLVGLVFLNLLLRRVMARDDVLFVIACICFYPFSYFFSTPHSESLFFCMLVLLFFLINQNSFQIVISIVLGMLLCARPTGFLIIPGIVYYMVEKSFSFTKVSFIMGVSLAIVSLFFLHLYYLTGDPLAWAHHQKVWGRGSGDLTSLTSILRLYKPWSFEFLHIAVTVVSISASAFFLKKKQFSYAFIILVPLLVCLGTGTLLSLSRIMMPLFPLFVFLPCIFKTSVSRICLLLVFSGIYSVLCLLYALHVSGAMT